MKIGGNDPCPCGSGLAYGQCCGGKHDSGEQRGNKTALDELKESLRGKSFDSLDDANAFLRQFNEERNQAPRDNFHGLSAEQMHRFLHFPFDTPHLATFPTSLDGNLQAPIVSLFNLLAAGVGEDGLKATATGNLPRNFCRESARTFWGEEEYRRQSRFGEMRTELEFWEMHVVRLVAGLAGLIRKTRGKFTLSGECRKLLGKQGQPGIYPRLFRAFVEKYNWAYSDRFGEIPLIQQSFLFTLYLLTRYGGEWRSSVFYEDNFLRAFPALLSEVQPLSSFYSPEKVVRRGYSIRSLERFAYFLGLVEIDRGGNDGNAGEFRVRKLPLLERVVRFHG